MRQEMASILIIEDEPNIASGLKFNLEMEGYRATVLETAEAALDVYSDYDLILLDIMLPGMSGIDLLKKIRVGDYKQPVLILSAKASEEDMIAGLESGADDYVTKPFSLPELLLRVRRILERQSWAAGTTPQKKIFTFGEHQVSFDTLEARTNEGVKSLTQYECLLLKYLIENRHRTVSREELLREVWGYDAIPETRTVDIFIGRLRKMFEQDAKHPRHIRSYRGVGYRFFENRDDEDE
jgi:two-component system, OmpR family, alkaline phosphatase synthesis response regulator PhoP